jgi:formylglycine-generating enzyme required for sulfatase activity
MAYRRDTVTVQPFCLDLTEVTVDAYGACVRGGRCSSDHVREKSNDGQTFVKDTACNDGIADRGEHPMNCVNADQASAFCRAEEALALGG